MGIAIGTAIGSLILVLLIVVIVFVLRKRKKEEVELEVQMQDTFNPQIKMSEYVSLFKASEGSISSSQPLSSNSEAKPGMSWNIEYEGFFFCFSMS